jgi:hypothetical protein
MIEVLFVFCDPGRYKTKLPRIQIRSASKFKLLTQPYVLPLIDLDRPAGSQSYMWVRRSGAPDHPVVLYDYAPSRAGSVPTLNALWEWLDKTLLSTLPKGLLGRALGYLNKYWEKLIRYTEDGEINIDNNLAENAPAPSLYAARNGCLA